KIVPFLSRSVHWRASAWPASGLVDEAKPSACCARNLPTDTFSAVLPLPKRSYDAPKRTAQSFQHGRHGTAAMFPRAVREPGAMNRPAAADCAGADALK